jgi:hypothetical protein
MSPSTYTPRVWQRVTPRTEVCYLNDQVRVQRERLIHSDARKQFMYEVHRLYGGRWERAHTMLPNAALAFEKAGS